MDELSLHIDGPVASIAIDRGTKRNALTQQMWEELALLAMRASKESATRVVVVRSRVPGVFSAGADIGEYRAAVGDPEWGMASQARVGRALAALRAIPVPTIALIDGPCIGGGSGIALACDFRIAAETATFAITPARLGLVFPHEDIAALANLVGLSATKRILFTGERFDATWAARIGFLDEVCQSGEMEATLRRWVDALIAVAPGSVRSMKHMVNLVQQGVRSATPDTLALVEAALRSRDHLEGVTAFLEGRRADFTG